jgi:hypothetical protein
MPLPGGLHVLQHPMVLVISGGLLFVEFFADKIPVVDSVWDLFQSVLHSRRGGAGGLGLCCRQHHHGHGCRLMGGTLAATSQAPRPPRVPHQHLARTVLQCGSQSGGRPVSLGAIWLALTNPLVFAAVLLVVVMRCGW